MPEIKFIKGVGVKKQYEYYRARLKIYYKTSDFISAQIKCQLNPFEVCHTRRSLRQ